MANKKAGKAKKATAKPAVAPATASPKNGHLSFATVAANKLIVRFEDGKELSIDLANIHPMHKHFGSRVEVINNHVAIPVEANFLKVSASQLLELAKPVNVDGYERLMQQFDHLYKIYDGFSVWLKNELKKRKMTQDELAKLSGVHFTDISNYYNDKTRPKIPRFFQILLSLKIDPAKL